LPRSERYPESEDEYATVLSRHHAVLDALGLRGRCFVLSMLFDDESMPAPAAESVPLPRAVHWRTVPPLHDEEMEMVIYATESEYPSAELDALLRAVADEELVGVILVPPSRPWLYHPYDSGADVIAETPDARDGLRQQFAPWLSSHPRGL
jgi:hypothetical protein